jgi:protein-tyrosine phosphatase
MKKKRGFCLLHNLRFGTENKLKRVASKKVLFICTANYYRSRFAEAAFNHYAERRAPDWCAFSRGLAIGMAQGPISPHTKRGLERYGIERRHTAPGRVQLQEADLLAAHLIVAMKKTEHRSMIAMQFPEWVDRITYWNISDLCDVGPENILPVIERQVIALIDTLCEKASPSEP